MTTVWSHAATRTSHRDGAEAAESFAVPRPGAVAALTVVVVLLLVDTGFGVLPAGPMFGVVTPLRVLVLAGVAAAVATRIPLQQLRTRLDLPIGLLVFASLIPAWQLGAWPGLRGLLTTVAVFYLVVALRRRTSPLTQLPQPQAVQALTLVVLLVVAAAGCVAVAQVAQGVPTGFCRTAGFADAPCRDGALNRAIGTFANPNLVAAFLVLLAPLGILRVLDAKEWQERVTGGLLVAASYAGVLVTFSRSGYVAAVASLVVLAGVLSTRRPQSVRRLGWGAAALGGTVAVLALLTIALGAVGIRREIWSSALQLGFEHPAGVGLDRAGAAMSMTTRFGAPVLHAHNLWLNWFAEAGVLGLLAFTALTVGALVCAAQASRQGSRLAGAVLAGLAGFLLIGLVDDPANLNRIAVAFWIVLALAAAEAPATWRRTTHRSAHRSAHRAD